VVRPPNISFSSPEFLLLSSNFFPAFPFKASFVAFLEAMTFATTAFFERVHSLPCVVFRRPSFLRLFPHFFVPPSNSSYFGQDKGVVLRRFLLVRARS